jgi:hypothetical protein
MYTAITPQAERQAFWLGRIMGIDPTTSTVDIKLYHTSSRKNMSESAKYRAWTGAKRTDVIDNSRLLRKVTLTGKNRIPSAQKVRIQVALDILATDLMA